MACVYIFGQHLLLIMLALGTDTSKQAGEFVVKFMTMNLAIVPVGCDMFQPMLVSPVP